MDDAVAVGVGRGDRHRVTTLVLLSPPVVGLLYELAEAYIKEYLAFAKEGGSYGNGRAGGATTVVEIPQTVPVRRSFVFLGSEEQELRPSPRKRSSSSAAKCFMRMILLRMNMECKDKAKSGVRTVPTLLTLPRELLA